MPIFNVWGSVELTVDFEIEATDETEARKKAIQMLIDTYHLDYHGGLIKPDSIEYKFYVDDIDE